jgi:hypothetical protein
VIFYFNTALVGAALMRMDGQDPSVKDGLNIANSRLGSILGYAVISATVGMVLRWIQERGFIGEIVGGLVGFAWNVATFLVVPVLVIENIGPIDAVKRSAGLLRQTWGEQLIGNFGMGTVFGLIGVAMFFLIGLPLIFLAAATSSAVVIILAIAIIVLMFVGLALISNTLSGIYTAALYRYATTGEVALGFSPVVIENAFKQKRK